MTPTPFDRARDEAADAELERDHTVGDKPGFLQRPYDRYRFHNGFKAGWDAAMHFLRGKR